MRKHLIISLLFACLLPVFAKAQTLSEGAQISLLTCAPGKPLYFHYGHAAIRVQDTAFVNFEGQKSAIDWTFNYGIFDFNAPHFYTKFVKGETDYMLGLEYTSEFLVGAAVDDRAVSFQPLNLTQEQKQGIMDALLINYQPENRYYRYNFVYDNCATRPWKIISKAMDLPVDSSLCGKSWRQNIDYYTGRWSWGKFGINLVFGYGADEEMTVEQSLFLPENLMNYVSGLGITDNEYTQPFVPRNSIFWLSPELLMIVLFIAILALTIFDAYRKKQTWGFDIALYVVYFILGIICCVLLFFSTHPFVDTNLNSLYLNPIWLVFIILSCWEKGRQLMLKFAPWLLGCLVLCLAAMLIKGQTLHLMLALVFAHMLRLYVLKRAFEKHEKKEILKD